MLPGGQKNDRMGPELQQHMREVLDPCPGTLYGPDGRQIGTGRPGTVSARLRRQYWYTRHSSATDKVLIGVDSKSHHGEMSPAYLSRSRMSNASNRLKYTYRMSRKVGAFRPKPTEMYISS